ncbi:MAG: hypothetical protein R3C61_01300 [Bacteroidia bacterium]
MNGTLAMAALLCVLRQIHLTAGTFTVTTYRYWCRRGGNNVRATES